MVGGEQGRCGISRRFSRSEQSAACPTGSCSSTWGRSGRAAEAAFAYLAERHGPMVIRTCRACLRDEHAAEDAFQATFLVLVQRALSALGARIAGTMAFQVAVRVSAKGALGRDLPPPA